MILQALQEYYDRKAADPASGIAPLGWEWKRIPFLVVFEANGTFIRLEDTRERIDGRVQAKAFLVPSLGEAKGNGIKSNLFWENAEYLFGIPLDSEKLATKGAKYTARVVDQHAAFVKKIRDLYPTCSSNPDYLSALRFAEQDQCDKVAADPLWEEAVRGNQSFLMCLAGKGPVPSIPEIKESISRATREVHDDGNLIRCLVTGELDEPSRLEPDIKGVRDANPTGAHIVAVNNKISSSGNGGATPAFASFMKEQGANSPIGRRASLSYTTALNTLLSIPEQKIFVGDSTVVVWSSRKTNLENDFADLFGGPGHDDPAANTAAITRLFNSVKTGAFSHENEQTRFYVLGLSPNAARISVRFWHDGTVAEMESRFADWFENLRIVHGPKDREHLSLWRLLCSVAPLGKSENVPPNLAGAVMRSILEGTPYPATLLSSAIVRIKAERDVGYPRAKIVKAFLNHNLNPERKLTVSLDKENKSVGYRLGRLFAVLEQIQLAANNYKSPNATIRDKFYASASATPAAVFGNLMRLKNHHLAKLPKTAFFEDLIGEIVAGIQVFPPHLSLDEQGMFAIGYYHQRQDFFTKKEKPEADGDPAKPDANATVQTELSL